MADTFTSGGNTSVCPTPKLEEDFYDWYERHAAKVREAAKGNHPLVFVGDSITHLFEGDPNRPGGGDRVWNAYYGRRGALNLGFGWDRTQNVLYRLAHGEFDGQTPRLIVLLIGTNNLTGTEHARENTPDEIAAGVAAIRALLQEASPASRILLLGIFPRSTPDDPIREKIRETNVLLRRFAAEQEAVDYIDFGNRFLAADGTIPTALMADSVHPTEAGYRVWAEAIEPIVARALGERA